eukprot:jgi/Mesvir1/20806/Mv07908-RA.1
MVEEKDPSDKSSEPATPASPEGDAPAEGISKKAAKKAAAKAEKEAKKAARAAEVAQEQGDKDEDDPLKDNYGDLPLIQSREISGRKWTNVADIDEKLVGTTVLIRGRVHTVRGKGKTAFLVIRDRFSTVQVVLFVGDKVSKGMVKYACSLSKETVVDIEGDVVKPEQPVEACTQPVEIQAFKVFTVSKSASTLPFQLEDASRSEKELAENPALVTVGQDVRLDNRVMDLRTPANQAIFRVESGVCQLFREALLAKNFIEIHTPKMIAGASEGGSAVFRLDYMGTPACLAQSPQLYKQMCICADMDRVFEIGPVFRAEQSFTHRHLCEFTGLDIEMAIREHFNEVLDVLDELFVYIFDGLTSRFEKELAAIGKQYPFEPFQYLRPSLRLTFKEGVALLKENGIIVDPLGDLNTESERALGRIVKKKYNTDFFMLTHFPLKARPFYTMPCHDDPDYTCSFDIFMRGEEIISGAQRVHDAEFLTRRAIECGIAVDTIAAYIDSFKLGAPPHGGCGVGLERVVMLFCGLNNIRKTSLFPRDPKRIVP